MSSIQAFSLDLRGDTVKVSEHLIGKQKVFRIAFPDNRQTLVVTKAKGSDIGSFWTSIPEGRQEDAEVIGELIDDYFRNLK